MAREEPLLFMVDRMTVGLEGPQTLSFMVPPINTTKHNQFMRDMGRLQWFAIGHGYEQAPDKWTGKFEHEEYNCVLRYLNKFGWAPAHECTECGKITENIKE